MKNDSGFFLGINYNNLFIISFTLNSDKNLLPLNFYYPFDFNEILKTFQPFTANQL